MKRREFIAGSVTGLIAVPSARPAMRRPPDSNLALRLLVAPFPFGAGLPCRCSCGRTYGSETFFGWDFKAIRQWKSAMGNAPKLRWMVVHSAHKTTEFPLVCDRCDRTTKYGFLSIVDNTSWELITSQLHVGFVFTDDCPQSEQINRVLRECEANLGHSILPLT